MESLKDSRLYKIDKNKTTLIICFFGFASMGELLRNARHENPYGFSRNDGIMTIPRPFVVFARLWNKAEANHKDNPLVENAESFSDSTRI